LTSSVKAGNRALRILPEEKGGEGHWNRLRKPQGGHPTVEDDLLERAGYPGGQ
jgi:hypothetical protein